MKIAINGRFLTRRITGVERYARELIKALPPSNDKFQFVLLAPSQNLFDLPKNIDIIKDNFFLKGHLWEQFRLPYLVKKYNADILWSPCNTGPAMVKEQIVTIHDAAVFAHPEGFSKKFVFLYNCNKECVLAPNINEL